MGRPRVLTFNFHEPYLALLAQTGYDFTVGLYSTPPLARRWRHQYRPVPRNMTLVEEPVWRAALAAGEYDVAIAHNETNAIDLFSAPASKLLVCHNRKSFLQTTVSNPEGNPLEAFARLLERLREQFAFVFISESKRADYGLPGRVIPPGIDVEEYGGYTGEVAEILRVGNLMRLRNLIFDVDLQERLCAGLPNRVVGHDPDIPAAREAESFEDLRALYRTRRCLLHVTRPAYEDGYNLAALEAMACGMPVVSLANPTSPLTDGLDGFVSDDESTLRDRLELLLRDPGAARELGARARETVAVRFPIAAFVARWSEAIEEAAQRAPRARHVRSHASVPADDAPRIQAARQDVDESGCSGYYRNVRPEVAQFVPLATRHLLDVGCGAGDFGAAMKERGVSEVHGIELAEGPCRMAAARLDRIFAGDIEEMELPYADGYYDCITFNDVLEHLREPAETLRKTARALAPDGVVVISLPNVRFCEVLGMLGQGRWQYADAGIMDRGHLRFFTAIEMRLMVEAAGLEVLDLLPLSYLRPEQAPRNPDGSLTIGRVRIDIVDDDDYRDLLTYQYLVIAGKPGADRLAKARTALELRENEVAYALAGDAPGVDEGERHRIMAKAAARMGRLTTAEGLYRKALEQDPGDAGLAAELGLVLVGMNRAPEARPYLEHARAADPGNDRVLGGLGLVCLAEGRVEEAMDLLRNALDADLDNEALLDPFLRAAEELGRLPAARAVIERYAEFYPGNLDLACRYAAVLAALGECGKARERLESLLEFAPGHAEALRLLSQLQQDGTP